MGRLGKVGQRWGGLLRRGRLRLLRGRRRGLKVLRLLKLFGLLVQMLGRLYVLEPLRRDWLLLLHSLGGFSH